MKQYPYELQILVHATEAVQNADGDFVSSDSDYQTVSACRDEANSGGQRVQLADGSSLVYDTLIQLPLLCPDVEAGASLRVVNGDSVRVQGTAKRFSRDQLHCRIWV